MANVILANRTKRPRRMLVLNLTAKVAPVKITTRTVEQNKQGDRRVRVQNRHVPDSIRIPAGAEVEVDETYLGAPDVIAAIQRRELLVKRNLDPAKPTAPAANKSKGKAKAK